MDNKDWYNDGIWECPNCGTTFKVYVLGELEEVKICPICGIDDFENGLIAVEEDDE